MKHRPAIALLIETSNSYARGLLEGIIAYVRAHDAWSIWLPEQRRGEAPPEWIRDWKGDGIIARIETEEIAQILRKTQLPVVDVSAARPLTSVPWVETDDTAIAKMAVEHLAERGFRRLAFAGDSRFNWSRFRQQAFVTACDEAGLPCDLAPETWQATRRKPSSASLCSFPEWLTHIEKPLGLFCCYDIKAQQVLDVCRTLNIAVPEQVAVLGVDNDPILCNLCTPPLSSVIPDAFRTGYTAAELLERMLRGETVSPQPYLIPPLGIETRQSTETLAVEDPVIAEALRFIRERARDGIDVSDVLKVVPWSRRVFESRFQQIVGRSPHQEIVRVRLSRVQQLLADTDLSLSEIAMRTGFEHPEYLSVVFKRELGITPSAYRQKHQSATGVGAGRSRKRMG
ncbi:helix-turn-helix domain-containing protein [bacterium]|nr:helix-turn-helix domain-containing protein [bacterium]